VHVFVEFEILWYYFSVMHVPAASRLELEESAGKGYAGLLHDFSFEGSRRIGFVDLVVRLDT
jgi:hypothetical protein